MLDGRLRGGCGEDRGRLARLPNGRRVPRKGKQCAAYIFGECNGRFLDLDALAREFRGRGKESNVRINILGNAMANS